MPDKDYFQKISKVLQNDAENKNIPFPGQQQQDVPVKKVEFLAESNAKKHHTDMFDLIKQAKQAIYRRGDTFEFQIHYHEDVKDLKGTNLDFVTGGKPYRKNYKINLSVPGKSDGWEVKIKSKDKKILNLEVKIDKSAPVGIWRLTINWPEKKMFQVTQHIYILFNPWCKDDDVYMKDEDIKEYILNTEGVFGMDKFDANKKVPSLTKLWKYDQFHSSVITAGLYFLEKVENYHLPDKGHVDRTSPVEVTRALTLGAPSTQVHEAKCKELNECVCRCLVVGKWTDLQLRYPDERRHPTTWSSSKDILIQYMKNLQSVRYGQCWVFAGLACSVCRALGIPSRVVTNFSSAHDTNKNAQVDIIWAPNATGGLIPVEPDPNAHWDSRWNFHVWTDVWMARPDLSKEHGGWQAIDACPQEVSWDAKGKFKDSQVCGPASLKAIKEGDVMKNYDTFFIYSSLSSQHNRWTKLDDEKAKLTAIEKDYIGLALVTKKKGKITFIAKERPAPESMENIINDYKVTDSAGKEKILQKVAETRKFKLRKEEDVDTEKEMKNVLDTMAAKVVVKNDVHFELVKLKSVMIGGQIVICGILENKSNKKRTVELTTGAHSIEYTGKLKSVLNISGSHASVKKTIELVAGQREINALNFTLTPEMYIEHLTARAHIRVYVAVVVKETKKSTVYEDFVVLQKPYLKMQIPDKPKKGKPLTIGMKLTNPVNKELKDCAFHLDLPCLNKEMIIKFRNVKPNENVSHEVKITPENGNSGLLLAHFFSDLLMDVEGSGYLTFV